MSPTFADTLSQNVIKLDPVKTVPKKNGTVKTVPWIKRTRKKTGPGKKPDPEKTGPGKKPDPEKNRKKPGSSTSTVFS
jgi:hypothetical protein